MTGSFGIAPTSAWGRSVDRPRAIARRFGNQAGSRAYDLFVPPGRSDGPLPLVVMLHGCSQSSRDFAIGTGMDGLAEELGFLVAYPDQPRSANMAKSWHWFREGDQRRDEGEPSILAGLTRQVMDEFDVDPSRVYVAGLSSGGAAASVMAMTYPDLYAAVGIHSGLAHGSAGSMAAALGDASRGSVPTAAGDATDADHRLPRRPRQDRLTRERRPGHRAGPARRGREHCHRGGAIRGRNGVYAFRPDRIWRFMVLGTMGPAWRRPCLVRWPPRRFAHRPHRSRRKPEDAPFLPVQSKGSWAALALIPTCP